MFGGDGLQGAWRTSGVNSFMGVFFTASMVALATAYLGHLFRVLEGVRMRTWGALNAWHSLVESSGPWPEDGPSAAAATPTGDASNGRAPLVNPYVAGNPITGSEMFFGREDVFEFVRQALVGQHQDNPIVLCGQPRTGKTSVLYQMHRKIDSQYLPVLIDLHALSMVGISAFLWETAILICRMLQRSHGVHVNRPGQEEFRSNPRDFFQEEFLPRVWEAIGDRRLLLMFDEAVQLEEQVAAGQLEGDVFGYLRHLMQHVERLGFIFELGSTAEAVSRESAVLFKNDLYKRISFLESDSARLLITEPARDVLQYEDGAIQGLLDLGAGHAYYTQLICHTLFSRFAGDSSVTTEEGIREVLGEVLERGTLSFKAIWDQASPLDRLVLSTMADLMAEPHQLVSSEEINQALEARQIPLSMGEIGGALGNLVSIQTVNVNGGYSLAVDLLRRYLRENQRLEWVQEELGAGVKAMGRT